MLENLSPREKELFNLLIKGVSPKEIAYKLNLKPSTVDYYRTKLYNKLGVHSIQELLVKYSTNGKENAPELAQSEEKITVPQTKKHKKFKFLLSVGAAIIAFSVLFVLVITLNRKPSFYIAPEGAIPITNLGFSPTSDQNEGGKSTSEVYVSKENINGKIIDNVLNIQTNLVQDNNQYAGAYTENPDLIKRLRQANGIRFKALGDGKSWVVEFHTKETTPENNYAAYIYIVQTVRDQVIDVDIPYSSLILPDWWEQKYSFDFNKETISSLVIIDNFIHGYGSALLQIYNFEIY
jgi:DNA-binding CsgD family transcriptional regulator